MIVPTCMRTRAIIGWELVSSVYRRPWMKAEAGRGQDLADIDELNLLYNRKSSYDS